MAEQKLVITGIPPYDGEYVIADSGFTNQEYHHIKQISGVRAGELQEAIQAGDAAVMVALCSVILQRHGKVVQLGLLWEAHEESFDVKTVCPHCQVLNDGDAKVCVTCGGKLDDEGDEERPPATATSGGTTNEPAAVAETNES